MSWLQVELTAPVHAAEPLADVLGALGAQSVTLSEGPDVQPVLEPAPGAMPLWPEVIVSALFTETMARSNVVAAICAATGLAPERIRISSLQDRDWVREFRENLAPRCFGGRLWICPSGIALPDDNAATLTLEPGLAFGSGSHPTTALCLEWLAAGDMDGLSVLDWGCGSGILGLAALALGARHVTAVDIDPQALEATAENARVNGLSSRLRVIDPEQLSATGSYDIVVANILAGTLLDLAPRLREQCRAGARVALSGILTAQASAVCEGCLPWMNLSVTAELEGWALVSGHPVRAAGT